MSRAEEWCVKLGHVWPRKKRRDGNRRCLKCGAFQHAVKTAPGSESSR